jgi:hypothetical protein
MTSVGFKLPSAWAYPATTHIDLSTIAAPSSVAIAGTTLDALFVTWTSGDPTLPVEVFLQSGASLTANDTTRIGPSFAAGTVRAQLPILTPGSQYTVGVRHRDTNGGASSLTTFTFTCTAGLASLDRPSDPNGFSGPLRVGFAMVGGTCGLAVAAAEFLPEASA